MLNWYYEPMHNLYWALRMPKRGTLEEASTEIARLKENPHPGPDCKCESCKNAVKKMDEHGQLIDEIIQISSGNIARRIWYEIADTPDKAIALNVRLGDIVMFTEHAPLFGWNKMIGE